MVPPIPPVPVRFAWPATVSLVRCPVCGVAELWHGVEVVPATGPWSEPVMRRAIGGAP